MGVTAKPVGKFRSILQKIKNEQSKEAAAQKKQNASKDKVQINK